MNFVVLFLLCFQAQRHALNEAIKYETSLGPYPHPPDQAHMSNGVPRWPINGTCDCEDCDTDKSKYTEPSHGSTLENVAFGKHMDGTFREETPTCAATNGYECSSQTEFYVWDKPHICYFSGVTSRSTPPWLVVNLQCVVTFKMIDTYILANSVGLRGISNTGIFVDGAECYIFGDMTKQPMKTDCKHYTTICKEALSGQYVLIQKQRINDRTIAEPLSICELRIYVCPPGTYESSGTCYDCKVSEGNYYKHNQDHPCSNYRGWRYNVYHEIAINKPAKKIDNDCGGMNDRDGYTINDYFPPRDILHHTCTIMETRIRSKTLYWRVDMLRLNHVNHVRISSLMYQTTRFDYLKNFSVVVTYGDSLPASPNQEQLCQTVKKKVPVKSEKKIYCHPNIFGRYLWITATDNLGMCKVRVYGRPIYLLEKGSNCRDTSEYIMCHDGDCVKDAVKQYSQEDGTCKATFLKSCSKKEDCEWDLVCHHGLCKSQIKKKCRINDHCVDDLVCDVDDQKCKRENGKTCEPDDGECKKEAFCDNVVKKCTLKLHSECDGKYPCPSGASCQDGECCCKTFSTEEGTIACKPVKNRVGGDCGTDENCKVGICKDGKCRCLDNQELFTEDSTTCRQKVGTPCSDRTSETGCNIGAVCEKNICKLLLKGNCKGNEQHCKAGLVCEDGTCKLPLGQSCVGSTDMCVSGTTCSKGTCKICKGGDCRNKINLCESGFCSKQDNSTCRIDVEKPCTSETAMFCRNGSICEDAKVCKQKFGEGCNSTSQCQKHHQCSGTQPSPNTKICKVRKGQSCSKDADCDGNSVCDLKICRIGVGKPCTSETATFCRNGSVCEDEKVCKQKFKEECRDTAQCQKGFQCTARKTSPATKGCRLPEGHNCSSNDDCAEDSICDHQKICRTGKNGTCTDHSTTCLSGAQCSKGQCLCNQKVTNVTTDKCDALEKVVSGSCGENSSCLSQGAFCDAKQKCQCRHNFKPDPATLLCLAGPGYSCSANGNARCMRDLVCDVTGVCAIKANGSCKGEKQGKCRLGTYCDSDGICRRNVHGRCDDDPTFCRNGTTCDTLKTCKYGPGELCREDMECVAGSLCNQTSEKSKCHCTQGVSRLHTGTCIPLNGIVGGQCQNSQCKDPLAVCNSQGHCKCREGYTGDPRLLSCAKALGEKCSENTEDHKCSTGLICDPADSTCRIDTGQKCDKKMPEYCRNGSVCDYDSVCRLDLHEDCTGTNSVHCKIGTFCDFLGQCTEAVGAPCSVFDIEESCAAGARCVNSVCVCINTTAYGYGAICQPMPGRVGSSCELACEDDDTECVDNVCKCQPGADRQRNFTCARPSRSSPASNSIAGYLVWGSIGAALGLFITAIAWNFNRNRQNKKREEIVASRRATMQQLSRLSLSAQSLQKGAGEETGPAIHQEPASVSSSAHGSEYSLQTTTSTADSAAERSTGASATMDGDSTASVHSTAER